MAPVALDEDADAEAELEGSCQLCGRQCEAARSSPCRAPGLAEPSRRVSGCPAVRLRPPEEVPKSFLGKRAGPMRGSLRCGSIFQFEPVLRWAECAPGCFKVRGWGIASPSKHDETEWASVGFALLAPTPGVSPGKFASPPPRPPFSLAQRTESCLSGELKGPTVRANTVDTPVRARSTPATLSFTSIPPKTKRGRLVHQRDILHRLHDAFAPLRAVSGRLPHPHPLANRRRLLAHSVVPVDNTPCSCVTRRCQTGWGQAGQCGDVGGAPGQVVDSFKVALRPAIPSPTSLSDASRNAVQTHSTTPSRRCDYKYGGFVAGWG